MLEKQRMSCRQFFKHRQSLANAMFGVLNATDTLEHVGQNPIAVTKRLPFVRRRGGNFVRERHCAATKWLCLLWLAEGPEHARE